MGETMTRLRAVTPRRVIGVNSFGRSAAASWADVSVMEGPPVGRSRYRLPGGSGNRSRDRRHRAEQ
jgi:hypothetical protein